MNSGTHQVRWWKYYHHTCNSIVVVNQFNVIFNITLKYYTAVHLNNTAKRKIHFCVAALRQDFICVVFDVDWLYLLPHIFPWILHHPALLDIFAQARNQIRICFDSIFLCTYGECVCLSFGNPDCWDQSTIIWTDFNQHFKWHAEIPTKRLDTEAAQREAVSSSKESVFETLKKSI